jgi:putative Mn2+ efflux pump MntP
MGYAAYYLTLAIGAFCLVLVGYGLFNDIRHSRYPQTASELAFTLMVAIGGWALAETAIKVLWP